MLLVLLPGLSSSVSATTFFSDAIESINLKATNNSQFSWTDSTYTSVVPHLAKTGDLGINALKFTYLAGEYHSEQRFDLATAYPDIWIRYWLQVPTNFKHVSANSKLFALWMDEYSAKGLGPTVIWEFWPDGSNGSQLAVHYAPGNYTVSNEHVQHKQFITYPADQGRWMQIVLHVRAATGPGAKNGLIETYRRWANESTFSKLHYLNTADISMPASGPLGWKAGYFMGWSNGAYTSDTFWYVNDVELSNSSLIELSSKPVAPLNPQLITK
jgi:hypothetical protein